MHPSIQSALKALSLAQLVERQAHRHGTIQDQIEARTNKLICASLVELARLENVVLPKRLQASIQPNATTMEADDLHDTEQRIASLRHDIARLTQA